MVKPDQQNYKKVFIIKINKSYSWYQKIIKTFIFVCISTFKTRSDRKYTICTIYKYILYFSIKVKIFPTIKFTKILFVKIFETV